MSRFEVFISLSGINPNQTKLNHVKEWLKGPLLLSAMFPGRFLVQSSESILFRKLTMTINQPNLFLQLKVNESANRR